MLILPVVLTVSININPEPVETTSYCLNVQELDLKSFCMIMKDFTSTKFTSFFETFSLNLHSFSDNLSLIQPLATSLQFGNRRTQPEFGEQLAGTTRVFYCQSNIDAWSILSIPPTRHFKVKIYTKNQCDYT